MKIENSDQPYPGRPFRFRVSGGTRPTRIKVYIGHKEILDKDCPDPPCHEMITIPPNARGTELLIVAEDLLGNIEQAKFEIEDSDSSSGMMSASG